VKYRVRASRPRAGVQPDKLNELGLAPQTARGQGRVPALARPPLEGAAPMCAAAIGTSVDVIDRSARTLPHLIYDAPRSSTRSRREAHTQVAEIRAGLAPSRPNEKVNR